MKRSLGILLSMLLVGGLGFSQIGCTLSYVNYQEPTPPPYPNAYRIQGRAQNEIDRIENAVNMRNMDRRVGDALADNDDSVLELVRYFQESSNPLRDLTPKEALFLDGMLDDNTILVDDAIRRRQAWDNYFGGSYVYNFTSRQDCRIYAVYSSYQLKSQQNDIETAYSAGHLSGSQADELRERVRVIRNQRLDQLRQNGRWELNGTQAAQTRQLAEDNSRLLKFRASGGAGNWTKDRSKQWNKAESNKTTYIKDTHWDPAETRAVKPGAPLPSGKRNQVAIQEQAAPTATPIPAAAPAVQVQEGQGQPAVRRDAVGRRRERQNRRGSLTNPQGNQVPPASPDSSAVSPASVPDQAVDPAAGSERAKDSGTVEQAQDQTKTDPRPKAEPRSLRAGQQERMQRMLKNRKPEKNQVPKEGSSKEAEPKKDPQPAADTASTPDSSDGDKDKGAKDDSDDHGKGKPGLGRHKSEDDK